MFEHFLLLLVVYCPPHPPSPCTVNGQTQCNTPLRRLKMPRRQRPTPAWSPHERTRYTLHPFAWQCVVASVILAPFSDFTFFFLKIENWTFYFNIVQFKIGVTMCCCVATSLFVTSLFFFFRLKILKPNLTRVKNNCQQLRQELVATCVSVCPFHVFISKYKLHTCALVFIVLKILHNFVES